MKISGTKPHCSLTTALISICLLLLSICSAQGNAFSYNPGGRSDEDFKRTIITTRGIEHAGNILYATDSLLVLWESTQPYNLDNLDEFATALPFYEIERVVIEKKGHFWSTAGKGFLIGGGIGALIGLASGDDEEGFIRFTAGQKAISLGIGIGLSSALISGIIDAINNIDDDFPIRGNPGKFKAILPILKKHAIFPSMPPYEVQVLLSKKSEEITTTSVKPIVQIGKEKTIPSAAKVHISVGSALTLTQANNDIIDAFESSGFGGRVGGFFGSIDYPVDHSRLFGYSLNGEYSLSERFLIGIEMAKIPRQEIHGK